MTHSTVEAPTLISSASPATDPIRYLTEEDTRAACRHLDPVAVIRDVLVRHGEGGVILPAEAYLGWSTPTGASARSINMPALVKGERDLVGTKIINASLGNIARGMPRASGLTMLFDAETGRIMCVMAAGHVSAARTASVTVAAAKELIRPDAVAATLIGAGEIAAAHLELLVEHLPAVRSVTVFDQSPDRADAFCARMRPMVEAKGVRLRLAASAEAAVGESDLVIPVTTTVTPYLEYDWLRPGAVVVNVSLDDVTAEVALRADLLFVDDWSLVSDDDRRLLGRMSRAGQVYGPADHRSSGRRVDAELGEVFADRHPGRTDDSQIILVNPFGLAIEDIALGSEVYRIACDRDLGRLLPR